MLLQTKLYRPQTRPGLVPRPQLIHQLNKSLNGHLTLVTAPAGFGKTTLITTWLQQHNTPTAWLSLDQNDNDPTQLLAYIITTLTQTYPTLHTTTLPLLQATPPPPITAIISQLANELLTFNTPTLLVLDDFHTLHNPATHNAINTLIDSSPAPFHLVIASRKQPALPSLSRLRGRGQVTELTASQLRFSSDEATQFFAQTMALQLPTSTVSDYAQKTEGWVTGLQLAALAVQQGHDPAGFPSHHPIISDYLLHEVITHQPPHIQKFWQQTAILTRLTAPLCAALTGQTRTQAQQTLAYLEKANLFLQPLDSQRHWYRYHHLLASYLQTHTDPALIQTSHRRAANWFAQHDAYPDAISHAFATNDFDSASNHILQTADELWTRGAVSALQNWLLRLPKEMILARPELTLYLAWTHFFSGQTQPNSNSFAKAKHLLQQITPNLPKNQLGIHYTIRAAFASVERNAPQAIQLSTAALTHLTPQQAVWRGVVSITLGMAHQVTGNITQAIAAFGQAARQNHQANNLSGANFAYSNWARLLNQQDDLATAELAYQEALLLIAETQTEHLPISGQIFTGFAHLRWQQGHLPEAANLYQQGISLLSQGGFPLAEPLFQLAQVQLLLGDKEAADGTSGRATTALQNPRLSPQHRPLAQKEQARYQKLKHNHAQQALIEPLSNRELEILHLIAAGHSNQQIADHLVIALSTIKWHTNNIYGKLNVRRRTQAIQKARTLNLLN